MSLICEFCKTIFKTNICLQNHKRNTKYCLIIQGKNSSTFRKSEYECNYCKRNLVSKQSLENHIYVCKNKLEYDCECCGSRFDKSDEYINHFPNCFEDIINENKKLKYNIKNYEKDIEELLESNLFS